MEQLLEELRQIQELVLLYPPQGDKGPNRVATVLSKQTLPQQALAKTLGLEQLPVMTVCCAPAACNGATKSPGGTPS